MSLFGSKKKIETTTTSVKTSEKVLAEKKIIKTSTKVPKAAKSAKPVTSEVAIVPNTPVYTSVGSYNSSGVVLRPRITEKSGVLSQSGVYTFEVARGANKNSVKSAIKSLYKVVPIKVAILNNPAKNVFVRGRRGVVPGVRKALVTLKKGDKIDFV